VAPFRKAKLVSDDIEPHYSEMNTALLASTIGINLTLAGIVITLFYRFAAQNGGVPDEAEGGSPAVMEQVSALTVRVTELERTLHGIVEEVEARIDRGNKIWRQIRARERREAESFDSEDGDDQEREDEQVPLFDDPRGRGYGVPSMPGGMANNTPYHEQVRQRLAALKAGRA